MEGSAADDISPAVVQKIMRQLARHPAALAVYKALKTKEEKHEMVKKWLALEDMWSSMW